MYANPQTQNLSYFRQLKLYRYAKATNTHSPSLWKYLYALLKHSVSSNPVTTTAKVVRAGGEGRAIPEQACYEG